LPSYASPSRDTTRASAIIADFFATAGSIALRPSARRTDSTPVPPDSC